MEGERVSALDSCTTAARDQSGYMRGKHEALLSSQNSFSSKLHSLYRSRQNSGTVASTLGTCTAGVPSTVLVPLGEAASADEQKDFLEKQLDSLKGQPLVGNLKCMDGNGTRARGGAAHPPAVCGNAYRQWTGCMIWPSCGMPHWLPPADGSPRDVQVMAATHLEGSASKYE